MKTKIVLILFGFIVAFATCEVIVRFVFPKNEQIGQIYEKDPIYGTRTKPNLNFNYYDLDGRLLTVETNSYGHRWDEYDTTLWKDSTRKKILFLGDSYTFGIAVNYHATFVWQTDSLLNDKNGTSYYSIINAGVGGWCTKQELLYGSNHLSLFNPDIVVITFCPNDPIGDKMFDNGFTTNSNTMTSDFWGKEFLRKHSHLYFMVASYFRKIRVSGNLSATLKGEADFMPFENIDSAWENTTRQFEEFYFLLKKHNPNARLILQTSHPWDSNLRDRFSVWTQQCGIEFVDLYNLTIHIPENERRFPSDGHWSEKIHRISAEALAAKIEKKNNVIPH